jgi:hypothetical protein
VLQETNFDAYNCVNVATALRVLARTRETGDDEEAAVCALSHHLRENIVHYEARSVAASLASLARLRALGDLEGLEGVVTHVGERARARELGPREISAVARALASVRCENEAVLTELARQLSSAPSLFRASDIVDGLTSLTRAGAHHAEAFEAAGEEVSRRSGDLNGTKLAALVWAYAKAGRRDAAVFGAVARELRSAGPNLSAADMAIAVWSFGKADVSNSSLMDTLGRLLTRQAGQLGARDIANVAWGYGTLGVGHAALFRALGREAACRPQEYFEGRHLAALVWGFNRAPTVSAPPELLAALTQPILSALPDMSAQEVAMTASGYAKGGRQKEARLVFKFIGREVLRRGEALPSLELATIMRAFATARRSPLTVFHAVASQLPRRAEDCDPGHLVTVLWAFAKASYPPQDPLLLGSLAETVEVRSEEFDSMELATVFWALAKLAAPKGSSVEVLSLCRAVEARLDIRRAEFSRVDMKMICAGFSAAGHRLPLACTQFLAQEAEKQSERRKQRAEKQSPSKKRTQKKANYKQKGLTR